jgi:hypothetical protein
VQLVDEVFEIPPDEWRYIDVGMNQQPALVSCAYQVRSKSGKVKLTLLSRGALPQFRSGRSYDPLAATAPGMAGSLRARPREPGEYVLVIDNRGNPEAVSVALRVDLDFGRPQALVRYPEPWRRVAVIVVGFAIFFGVAIWSVRRLLAGRRPL